MAEIERATTPKPTPPEGAGFTFLLDHALTLPGAYELPLRTMYTLNSSPTLSPPSSPISIVGNAFPKSRDGSPTGLTTATAAAQLQANIRSHISSQPSQPQSLPPTFITSFVSKVFAQHLETVDFPQALTSLDYLKDLESRRQNELKAALAHLGVDKSSLNDKEKMARDLPGVFAWVEGMDKKHRKVTSLYSLIYLGLRRWAMVNEMSLPGFSKANCIAMLNTLYPPVLNNSDFVQPTPQITAAIMKEQRASFFRYIQVVEKKGSVVLKNVMAQQARPGEDNGWPKTKEDLDNYLREANAMIEECLECTGRSVSPRSAVFPINEEEHKRKVDSGVSFGNATGYNSNRSSGHSHLTRPSTSSSGSTSNHSRHASREKALPVAPSEDDENAHLKTSGSALERIARELRKIGSRSNIREESRSRLTVNTNLTVADDLDAPRHSARSLNLKRSLRNIRSASRSRGSSVSRPGSGAGQASHMEEVPNFDADAMRRQREAWEAQHACAK